MREMEEINMKVNGLYVSEWDNGIEIHFELYDKDENIIGDLIVADTESVNHKELYDEVLAIVKSYYGE